MLSIRQKLAFSKVVESRGKKSIGTAMIEAGYSKNSAVNPKQNLTSSKSWQQLMEKFLPDNHLGKKHREFLDSPRIVRTYQKGNLTIETEETDANAVRALDMAYKLKGRYAKESEGNKTLIINVSGESALRYGIVPTNTNTPNVPTS